MCEWTLKITQNIQSQKALKIMEKKYLFRSEINFFTTSRSLKPSAESKEQEHIFIPINLQNRDTDSIYVVQTKIEWWEHGLTRYIWRLT